MGNGVDSWIHYARSSNEYAQGVEDFLTHAFYTRAIGDQISCPCKDCYGRFWHRRDEVYDHLICNGTDPSIIQWHFYEKSSHSSQNEKRDYAHDDNEGLIYDTHRLKRMAENQRRIEEPGIKALAYEVTCSRKDQNRKEKSKVNSKNDVAKENEYIPGEEENEQGGKSSNENDAQPRRRLSSRSKKVMAIGGTSINGLEKPQSSMASLLKVHRQTLGAPQILRKDEEQEVDTLEMIQQETIGEQEHSKRAERVGRLSGQEKCLQRKTLMLEKQQGKGILGKNSKKTAHNKILVSPGSLGAYVRMKKNSTTEKRPSTNIDSVSRERDHSFDDVTDFGVGLVEENETYESSRDYVSEGEDDINPKAIGKDSVEIINEPFAVEGRRSLSVKNKRTRGSSLCKDIHERTTDNRLPIILNGSCQPIGPNKETLDKFSRFLGSLARDSNLAPLNEINWSHVRDKDKIWEYVKTKFIIPEEGKSYVLQSIGALWRTHKSRVKKKYYYNFGSRDADNEKRSIPDSHLKDLLKYWDLEEVRMISERKKEASQSRKNRHTMGPVTFARKRHELQQDGGKLPSLALMYTETHKRAPGRKYKTPETNVEPPESKENELLGRCSKRAKRSCKSNVLIPDESLKPFKDEILKDTLAGVLKILENLPVEVLNPITTSLENPPECSRIGKTSH